MAAGRECLSPRGKSVLEDFSTIKDVDLLRGVDSTEVLRGFGFVLKGVCPPNTHLLSTPVTQIDDFISHNWTTGRVVKFFTLALHYNSVNAACAAWVSGLAVALLTVTGFLPITAAHLGVNIGAWATGHAVFLVVLLFGGSLNLLLTRAGCRRRRVVFLDRACIHQKNPERKLAGISSLAGFLKVSQRMVVIYNEHYLRRLWTTYEVASFLTLHEDSARIVILPTSWVPTLRLSLGSIFAGFASVYAVQWCLRGVLTSAFSNVPRSAGGIGGMLAVFGYILFIRNWQRSLWDIEKTVQSFSIKAALCAVESDRKVEEGNVATFMRCLGRVDYTASDRKALDEFDQMVQTELPGSIRHSFGQSTFPYYLIMAASMGFVLIGMDKAVLFLAEGNVIEAVADLVYYLGVTFVIMPLLTAIFSRILSWKLHLQGSEEVLFLAFLVVCAILPVSLLVLGPPALSILAISRLEGLNKVRALAVLVLVTVVYSGVTYYVFKRNRADCLKRPGQDSYLARRKSYGVDADAAESQTREELPEDMIERMRSMPGVCKSHSLAWDGSQELKSLSCAAEQRITKLCLQAAGHCQAKGKAVGWVQPLQARGESISEGLDEEEGGSIPEQGISNWQRAVGKPLSAS